MGGKKKGKGKAVVMSQAEFFQSESASQAKNDGDWSKGNLFGDSQPKGKIVVAQPVKKDEPIIKPAEPTPTKIEQPVK